MAMTPLPNSQLQPPSQVGMRPMIDARIWAILRVLRDRDNQINGDLQGWIRSIPDRLAAAVAEYLIENPPPKGDKGDNATDAQVAEAVAAYLQAHPPAKGDKGDNATDAQIATAVAAYLLAHPPAKGDKGDNATNAQVAAAVATYLQANPPAAGKNATTLLGSITWGQSAIAVVAGVRTMRVLGNATTNAGVAAAKANDPLLFVPTPGTGLPAGYMVGSVVAPEDGKVDVTFTGPALTVLQSYAISGKLYRLNP